jgi:cytochrome c nitrite reductase small subunit
MKFQGRTMRASTRFVLALLIVFGVAAGVGSYTFIYAKGYSYLSNDPAACANCHIMNDQFDGWIKGSHRNVATCNDCHTPHDAVAAKYLAKASNGFWHSFGFTTGRFPEPIRIKPHNLEITERTCRYCHEELTVAIEGSHESKSTTTRCTQCHSGVGHL